MAWKNINLSDVNPNQEVIPAGDYTFQLLGAKYSDMGQSGHLRLDVRAAIVSEGDAAGRNVFITYPDPESISARTGKVNDWVLKPLKRLEQALGTDKPDGEDMATYLNRVAGTRFEAPVAHRTIPTEAGEPIVRAEVNIFAVRPASSLN